MNSSAESPDFKKEKRTCRVFFSLTTLFPKGLPSPSDTLPSQTPSWLLSFLFLFCWDKLHVYNLPSGRPSSPLSSCAFRSSPVSILLVNFSFFFVFFLTVTEKRKKTKLKSFIQCIPNHVAMLVVFFSSSRSRSLCCVSFMRDNINLI